ncbi:MAG: glycosyltransferase family 4 protein [Acidobacteriota bacterium]|nr:glycosyltransferase family 4 protein [Acidobacteriota bacterium]
MKVLAIVPYQLDFCAGQRFRIELWSKELARRGIEVEFLSFTDKDLTDILHQPGQVVKKGSMIVHAFARQLKNALTAEKPDLVFVYREAAIIGPAIIERIVRRWNVPMVYDLDEPLFIPLHSAANGAFTRLRFVSKVNKLFEMSDAVFAACRALADYAEKYSDKVHIVPMSVDTERYKPLPDKKVNKKPIIVWVGSRTNQFNIGVAVPAMRRLRQEMDFTLRVIADDPVEYEGLDVEFFSWNYKQEPSLLQESDIGIVPVTDSEWGPYKFFFKTIQYMSTGLPVVGSALGSNLENIEEGKSGFLAKNEDDWYEGLKILLNDAEMRRDFGKRGREIVLERFDIEKQYDFLEREFKRLAQNGAGARKMLQAA